MSNVFPDLVPEFSFQGSLVPGTTWVKLGTDNAASLNNSAIKTVCLEKGARGKVSDPTLLPEECLY